MKLNKIIFGCALATGLMAFAPVQSQAAGGVISNQLYSVVNIKATYNYTTSTNGPIKKASFTNKQILKDVGYSSDVVLAMGPANKFYVVNKKTGAILKDLSVSNNLSINLTPCVSVSQSQGSSTNASTKATVTGNSSLIFSSAGDSFFLLGNYTKDSSASSVKSGSRTVSEKIQSTESYGNGNVPSLTGISTGGAAPMTCTGTFSSSGSGKLDVP